MDLVQAKDHYEIRLDLPGLKKEDIEVTYQDGVLTVRGERKQEEREEKDGTVVRQERYRGTFERTLRLPEKVDAARISARFEDGVLELDLPLLPEAKPVRLQIQ
jgi:HSP20 family protein